MFLNACERETRKFSSERCKFTIHKSAYRPNTDASENNTQEPQNKATCYAFTRRFERQRSCVTQPHHVSSRLRLPRPSRASRCCSVPQVHSTEKCVGTLLGRRELALTCALGEAAGAAADAWWRWCPTPGCCGCSWASPQGVTTGTGCCGSHGLTLSPQWETRLSSPSPQHSERKLVSECTLMREGRGRDPVCFVFAKSAKLNKGSTVVFSERYWDWIRWLERV